MEHWSSRNAATSVPPRTERGATSLEFVGIAVAVTLALAGAAFGLRDGGRNIGGGVTTQLQRGVQMTSSDASSLTNGRWRTWKERRTGGGDVKVHVPRDQLRMSPALEPRAWWSKAFDHSATRGPVTGAVAGEVCVLCTALAWSHDARTGASKGSSGRFLGGEGSVLGEARLALAAAEARANGRTNLGPLTLDAQGRVRAAVGGEATLGAVVQFGRDVQALEAEAGGMLGASAKAEGRVGASLLGIAVAQAGEVEGWAGVGIRGEGALRRDGGALSWKVGWGAALGLGGAAEWSGSVDVSKFPDHARRLGTRTLRAGIDLARGR